MKSKLVSCTMVVFLFLVLGVGGARANNGAFAEPQAPLGHAFTYQGQLKDSAGNLINNSCDFRFILYDAETGGAQVGPTLDKTSISVEKGLFTVVLDFGGSAFLGDARWLAVAVRCPAGGGSYTTLSPRQALTAAPYALDADLLDGQHATAFSTTGHNHWGQTWSGSSTPGLGLIGTTDAITATVTGGPYSSAIIGNNPDATYCDYAFGLVGTQGILSNPFCDSVAVLGLGEMEGVLGIGNTYGTGGVGQSAYAYGIFGRADGTNGTGVYGISNGASGVGVYGFSTTNTGTAYGVYGTSYSPYGAAVYGNNLASTGNAYGVLAQSASDGGIGVYGYTLNSTANATGVEGYTYSSTGHGVFGYADNNDATTTTGVYGRGDSSTGYGVAGHNYYGGVGVGAWSFSGNLIAAFAGDYPGGTLEFYVNQTGYVYANGGYNIFKTSNLDGETYATTSIQSTEAWLEDFGHGDLVNGTAIITIAPDFAGITDLSADYMVFVSLEGDCQGVYITNKTSTTFDVHELNSGKSDVPFSYRIVARPVGSDTTRLPVVTIPATVDVPRQVDNAPLPSTPVQLPQGTTGSSTYVP